MGIWFLIHTKDIRGTRGEGLGTVFGCANEIL